MGRRTLGRDCIALSLICVLAASVADFPLTEPALARTRPISRAADLSDDNSPTQKKEDDKIDKAASTAAGQTGERNSQDRSPDSILPSGATIVVADRPLTGPFSSPQQRGSRIFLPLAGIARALGDEIATNPQSRTVEVRRQTGATADFRARLNQVRENGSIVLVVSDTADIVFPPDPQELMLPVEIVSALLDVSIIVDQAAHVVRVSRTQQRASTVRAGADHGKVELYLLDYAYNFNLFSSSFNQYLTLHSTGRIADGRFEFLTNVDGGSSQRPITYRTGTFSFERPNGQKLIGGDFGTGTDLAFMSSLVRGVWAQEPLSSVRLTAFGGRVGSNPLITTVIDPLTGLPTTLQPTRGLQYDTNVFGSYVTFGGPSKTNPRGASSLFSSGMMYFNGPHRTGALLTGSARQSTNRNQFQADFGFGDFSGRTQTPGSLAERRVNGSAPLVDVSDVFSPNQRLTLQARYTYVGENFLSPQSAGFLVPMNQLAGGLGVRPTNWLSASVNGSTRTLLGGIQQRDRSLTESVSVTPRGPFPTLLFTHTETRGTIGNSSYTLLNATKEFNRWRLFANFTRIHNALFPIIAPPTPGVPPDIPSGVATVKPPSQSLNIGTMLRLNSTNTLQVSQFFGSAGTFGGDYDWLTSSFFSKRISLGAGFGYSKTEARLITTERFISTIELPRHQIMQITYVHSPTGSQLYAQLRGPLIKSRRAEAAANATLAELNSLGSFYGKVFQDVNLNGRFDPGVDTPQANVQVRVDGNFYTVTDASGDFRIDNVKSGMHSVYLDLLSVRADLTLLDSAQQSAFLQTGRDAIVDFRLVRTGRLRGMVWLDENGNGRLDEREKPLSDVRVVTGSGRDTLTDGDGQFVLGDLPPGEHVILVDEKTLPDNTRSAAGSLQVSVRPGGETSSVNFPIVPKPPDVNVRRFPTNGQ